jgi:hypothetical protein
MDFDWKQIVGPLVGAGGTVLGGLIGGPAGAVLGPLAGKALAEALGVEPTPDAVSDALARPDAGAVVAKVEAGHGPALAAAARTYLDDIADARAMQVELAKTGSPIAFGATAISILVTLGYVAMAVIVMSGWAKDSASAQLILGTMNGALATVIAFWLGSSAGSKQKDGAISEAIRSAASAAARAVKR